ncbi:uncharacterized protein METZ01_LOCUS494798, partial [marine metagenome]
MKLQIFIHTPVSRVIFNPSRICACHSPPWSSAFRKSPNLTGFGA